MSITSSVDNLDTATGTTLTADGGNLTVQSGTLSSGNLATIAGRGYTNITVSSNAAHVVDFGGAYAITNSATVSIVFTC
jgi:hypothetical protein